MQNLANTISISLKRLALGLSASALMLTSATAQEVQSFDPDEAYDAVDQTVQDTGAIDEDLVQPEIANAPRSVGLDMPQLAPPLTGPRPVPADVAGPAQVETTRPNDFDDQFAMYREGEPAADEQPLDIAPAVDEEVLASVESSKSTYGEDDLIGAAEGVFGKGAEGLAKMIQNLLKDQGEPNGYIVGREAGGAFVFGARYGSGTLYHKVEGEQKVYWTGPSLGLDAGANAANTFVLVYNLYDTHDLFKRYPAGEGQAYLIGGLHASYMRKGDVVLIPIRMGAGVRLGVNAGYMKFSKKQRWLPF